MKNAQSRVEPTVSSAGVVERRLDGRVVLLLELENKLISRVGILK